MLRRALLITSACAALFAGAVTHEADAHGRVSGPTAPVVATPPAPTYWILLDAVPNYYENAPMWFWLDYLGQGNGGVNDKIVNVILLNRKYYTANQVFELRAVLARMTPGNPTCKDHRFCQARFPVGRP